jgi:hypothetical protein
MPFPEDRKGVEKIADAWETMARLRERSMIEESGELFPATNIAKLPDMLRRLIRNLRIETARPGAT